MGGSSSDGHGSDLEVVDLAIARLRRDLHRVARDLRITAAHCDPGAALFLAYACDDYASGLDPRHDATDGH